MAESDVDGLTLDRLLSFPEAHAPDAGYARRLREHIGGIDHMCIREEGCACVRRDLYVVMFAEDGYAGSRHALYEIDERFGQLESALGGDRTAVLAVADACDQWGLSSVKNALIGALNA